MIESVAARWLLTVLLVVAVLFVAAALRSGRGEPGRWPGWRGEPGRRLADWGPAAFCVVMCVALIVMTWRTEPAPVTWAQVAAFGLAGLWFVLASGAGEGRLGRPSPTGVHHGLMAGAMIWMLVALPGAAGMRPSASGMRSAAMSSSAMSSSALSWPALVVTGLVAAYCLIASVPWLARAIGPGPRVTNPAAAGQAAMSAGMAVMLIAMM